MTVLYPEQGETFGGLVRRVMDGLVPGARARARVVTGGERFGLVVPESTAPPVTPPAATESAPDGRSAAGRKPATGRRRVAAGKEATV